MQGNCSCVFCIYVCLLTKDVFSTAILIPVVIWCRYDNSDKLWGLVVPGYRSRGSGFYSRRYHIFWKVVGLDLGPLSLVSTTGELRGRKMSGSGLEGRAYGNKDPSRWPRGTFYPQKLALTSPTSGSRSVGIVRSRTKAKEFSFSFFMTILEAEFQEIFCYLTLLYDCVLYTFEMHGSTPILCCMLNKTNYSTFKTENVYTDQ
jgi:hypothetical protein